MGGMALQRAHLRLWKRQQLRYLMMKYKAYLVLVCALSLSGCTASSDSTTCEGNCELPSIQFDVLFNTSNLQSGSGKQIIEIGSQVEWDAYIQAAPVGLPQTIAEQQIDFSIGKLFVMGLGMQSSGGFEISSTHATKNNNDLTTLFVDVTYDNCEFGSALNTHPYEIVFLSTRGLVTVEEKYIGTCD